MSLVAPLSGSFGAGLARVQARRLPVLGLAVLLAGAGVLVPAGWARLLVWSVAATLAFSLVFLALTARLQDLRRRHAAARLHLVVAEDAAPCFASDEAGQVLYRNKAADQRFGRGPGQTLAATLGDMFAHPSAVLYRLQSRAANLGFAREDVATRRGQVRLSVHRSAPGHFLWRLEEFAERGSQGRGADGVSLPMLVAGRTGAVLFANEAMRRLLGHRPRALDRVFTDLPLRSGATVTLAGADGPVQAVVVEIDSAAERREIYLLTERGTRLSASC